MIKGTISPVSPMLQAFVAGLQREPVAYAAGRKDGEEGARFRPRDFDAFSYACGFASARQLKGGATCAAKASKP